MQVPNPLHRVLVASCLLCTAAAFAVPVYCTQETLDALAPDVRQRIEQIAGMLEDQPRGFGRSISDRAFWDPIAQTPKGRGIVRRAESLLSQAMPVLTDDLYLLYTQTGSRTEAQNVMFAREDRLFFLTIAECLENKGRFTDALQEVLDSSVSYRSWVYPAHDGKLDNFHGRFVTVDLKSARDAHTFALCLHLLGDKISEPLAARTRQRIHELVLAPYARAVLKNEKSCNWKTNEHNWNSVCHAGVVGAALTMLPDKLDRALFVEQGLHFIDYYYKGFTADGYCSEGLGYWNYGFGQYIVLSEVIYAAARGQIDLFGNPSGLPAALYPFRVEIIKAQYPALADCSLTARPQSDYMAYVNTRLALNDSRWPKQQLTGTRNLFEFLLFAQFDSRPALQSPFASDHDQLRTWFQEAGVLICRPGANGSFAAVVKGGHNAENHNHNDLGAFIVTIDNQQVIVDPGSVEYTSKTFSKDRYTIKKLASYGHPVPLINGKEQSAGRNAQAKILRQDFAAGADTLVMDLASAYPDVKPLEKLERTFVYSREGKGCLEVTDNFEFSAPAAYETALITYGTYSQTGPNTLEITTEGKTAAVEFTADNMNVNVAEEVIESTNGSPRRIALRFEKDVKKGQIAVRIWPK